MSWNLPFSFLIFQMIGLAFSHLLILHEISTILSKSQIQELGKSSLSPKLVNNYLKGLVSNSEEPDKDHYLYFNVYNV